MGTLLSSLAELDRLSFRPFPTQPKAGLRVDNLLIGVDDRRRLYATGALSRRFAYTECNWNWVGDVLKALVRLGVVDQSVVDQHLQNVREREKMREARYALKHDVPELEKRYGVKLTKAQRAKIEKVAKPCT